MVACYGAAMVRQRCFMAEISNKKTWLKTRLTAAGTNVEDTIRILFERIYKHWVSDCGWTCVSSSNGVDTAGAGDNITADNPAHLVPHAEGGNHSWVLLQNNSIATGFQVLFNFTGTGGSAYECTCKTSIVGFTGGSLTNAPTSAFAFTQTATTWIDYPAAASLSANIFHSTDYACTRIFVGPTTLRGFMFFEVPDGPPAWLTTPNGVLVKNGATLSVGLKLVQSNRTAILATANRAVTAMAGATGDHGGAWPVDPVRFISATNTPVTGYLGGMFDAWHGHTSLATGDMFPADGSQLQVVINGMVFGNDGTSFTL